MKTPFSPGRAATTTTITTTIIITTVITLYLLCHAALPVSASLNANANAHPDPKAESTSSPPPTTTPAQQPDPTQATPRNTPLADRRIFPDENETHAQYIEEDYLENETDTEDDEDDDEDIDGGSDGGGDGGNNNDRDYWNPRNVPVGTHTFADGKVLTSWLPLEPRILEYCKRHDCEEESRRLEILRGRVEL